VTDDTTISCRPDLLVLYYPVIDTSEQGYGQKKIGDRWRELSPVDQVKAGLPATILFHGTGDTLTPYSGAERFHQRMMAVGNSCQLISHPAGGHGYLIFDLQLYEEALERTRSFLVAHSVLPADPSSSVEPVNRNRSTK
jgi:acetyl esterase/lipase